MNTGLFFGSFNPVHRGHEAMAASFLGSELVDELWILLTPSPPHKHVLELAPYSDRWNMLEIAFNGMQSVYLSDVEQRLPSPHYTIQTLDYLRGSHPDRRFYLCIGGDTLQTISTWYEYEKLSHRTELLVAERPGVSTKQPLELQSLTVHHCDHHPVAISSTEIREKLADGLEPGSAELNPLVMDYIRRQGLYGWKEAG